MENEIIQQAVSDGGGAFNWAYVFFKEYLIQTAILLFVVWILLSGKASGFLRRHKKTKVGVTGIEFETDPDGQADCPHAKCRSETQAHLIKLWEKMDKANEMLINDCNLLCELKQEIETLVKITEEIAVDQLKLVFYNSEMEEHERLIAGLRYVSKDRNHEMKIDVKKFCLQYPLVYRTAIGTADNLRFKEVDAELKRLEDHENQLRNEY